MAEMFTSAAACERMMGRWGTRLAPPFLEFAGIPGRRILDVGSGTGSLVQAVAERSGGSHIVGIDPAQPFIDYCTWDSNRGLELNVAFWQEAIRLDPAAEHRAERPRHCNQEGQLAAVWQATGFEGIEETSLEMRTDFVSFDDFWLPFTAGTGPQGVYVADLSSAKRDALRDALRRRLLGTPPDGSIHLRAKAWAVRGIVPDR